MAVLLFKLRDVPEDEADDIRELLETNNLDYYETSAGNWGISTPAIWLKNDGDLEKAKSLIEIYQHERGISQREAYAQLKNANEHRTMTDVIKENPVRFIAYILLVLVILYFSIKPFLSIGN
ncbi:DUF6164 family protein [Kaarinaea lacus]